MCHEVIIETALALGKPASDNMLILFGHLLLNIHLYSAKQKRSQNLKANKQGANRRVGTKLPIVHLDQMRFGPRIGRVQVKFISKMSAGMSDTNYTDANLPFM